jgi:hypothetical protein
MVMAAAVSAVAVLTAVTIDNGGDGRLLATTAGAE